MLLVMVFAILAAYSFAPFTLRFEGLDFKLRKTGISEVFEPPQPAAAFNLDSAQRLGKGDTVLIDTLRIVDTIVQHETGDTTFRSRQVVRIDTLSKEEFAQRMDTTAQRILLIGDSMLEGLRLRLRDYCVHNGHEMKTVIWYSATTKYFGQCDTLAYFIDQYNPTYILFVLGANELFVRDIIERRQHYVTHILKQIGRNKFIWIGPPNWKDDTGINDLIVKNTGEKRYFPSKNLTYARARDGAHPTHASAAVWMDSVAVWIMDKSMYPIRLEKPPHSRYKQSTNTTILKPIR